MEFLRRKKLTVFLLILIAFVGCGLLSSSSAHARTVYGEYRVITDTKPNQLILYGDTITIGNSTDTVTIARSDTGISFEGAYFVNVNWENSDLDGLDADLLDGLEGDSYLKSDRTDTFNGATLFLGDNPIKDIDWSNSDDGPGSNLDADFWDGHQYSDIDSDGDNQVDEADDADNVRSTYKGNDIDDNGDGTVNDAENVTSTYKGNDIDDDSDGKVNNSDQLDGYEASEFATTSEADTQISVYDSQTFLGAVRNLDFDTDLNVTVPGTDTAFIEVNEGSVDAGSVDGEDASDFASATGGAGSRQAQDSDQWDGNEYSRIDSNDDGRVDEADTATNSSNADYASDADASTYKGNDIDGDGDGDVENADNVTSTYKGNDIDGNGDGKVDSADQSDTSMNSSNAYRYKGNDIDTDGDGIVNKANNPNMHYASGRSNLPHSIKVDTGDFWLRPQKLVLDDFGADGGSFDTDTGYLQVLIRDTDHGDTIQVFKSSSPVSASTNTALANMNFNNDRAFIRVIYEENLTSDQKIETNHKRILLPTGHFDEVVINTVDKDNNDVGGSVDYFHRIFKR